MVTDTHSMKFAYNLWLPSTFCETSHIHRVASPAIKSSFFSMLPRQYITVYADCRGFCSWTDHKMLSAHPYFETRRINPTSSSLWPLTSQYFLWDISDVSCCGPSDQIIIFFHVSSSIYNILFGLWRILFLDKPWNAVSPFTFVLRCTQQRNDLMQEGSVWRGPK